MSINEENPLPFIKYILRTILAAYIDFEERVDYINKKLPTIELVRNAVDSKLGKFNKSDIMELVPSVSKSTIENMLKRLMEDEYIERHGKGKATFYVLQDFKYGARVNSNEILKNKVTIQSSSINVVTKLALSLQIT